MCVVCVLALDALTMDAVSAQPVAIITEVDGSVGMVADRQIMTPSVALAVEENSLFSLERGARVVLAYPKTGIIFEMQGLGRYLARGDGVEALGLGHLARRNLIPELRALRIQPDRPTLQASVSMRGRSLETIEAIGPRGNRFNRDPIRICWEPMGAEWRYRVRVIDDDGAIVFETWTSKVAIDVPKAVLIAAKMPYLWYVHAEAQHRRFSEAAGLFERVEPAKERALLRAEWAVPQFDSTDRVLIQIARRQFEIMPDSGSVCSPEGQSDPSITPITASPE